MEEKFQSSVASLCYWTEIATVLCALVILCQKSTLMIFIGANMCESNKRRQSVNRKHMECTQLGLPVMYHRATEREGSLSCSKELTPECYPETRDFVVRTLSQDSFQYGLSIYTCISTMMH
jgi:hypothetical protein